MVDIDIEVVSGPVVEITQSEPVIEIPASVGFPGPPGEGVTVWHTREEMDAETVATSGIFDGDAYPESPGILVGKYRAEVSLFPTRTQKIFISPAYEVSTDSAGVWGLKAASGVPAAPTGSTWQYLRGGAGNYGWHTPTSTPSTFTSGLPEYSAGKLRTMDPVDPTDAVNLRSLATLAGIPRVAVPPATAPFGAVYANSGTTAGIQLWIRGSSSWDVLAGDTGWRYMTSTMAAKNPTLSYVGNLYVRRVNDTVYLRLNGFATAADATLLDWTTLSGIRPIGSPTLHFPQTNSRTVAAALNVGTWQWYGTGIAATTTTEVSWSTTEPWPDPLPGSPT